MVETPQQQITEAKQGIQQSKQELAQEQAKTAEYQKRLEQSQKTLQNPNLLRKQGLGYLLSPAYKSKRIQELQNVKSGLQTIEQRKQELKDYQSQIKESEQQVSQYEQKYSEYQKQVAQQKSAEKAYQEDLAAFNIAKKYYNRGEYPFYESKKIREYYRNYANYRDDLAKRQEQLKVLKEQGLKPVYSNGQLAGFEDSKSGMSYRIEELPNIRPESLEPLSQAGLIEYSKPEQSYSSQVQTMQVSTQLQKLGVLGTERSGTQITTAPSYDTGKLYFGPTLYREVEGTVQDPVTGKPIALISGVKYVEPKIGKAIYREATPEETAQYLEDVKAGRELEAGNAPPKIIRTYGEVKGKVSSSIYQSNIAGKETLENFGITDNFIQDIAAGIAKSTPGIQFNYPARALTKGFVEGVLYDIKEKPFTNVAEFGIAYGAGFLVRGVPVGLKYGLRTVGLSKFANAPVVLGKTIEVGAGALLTGAYVVNTGSKIISSDKTLEERGRIAGVASKDILLFGSGYYGGSKTFDILRGRLVTLGRLEIDIPSGDYPSAPSSKQLKLFQENIYPELSEKPGAFHTTSQKFINKLLTPQEGTSELPGLYGSTMISEPFARISGSSLSEINLNKINVKKLLLNILSDSESGVAYLVPKDFRYSPASKIPNTPAKPLGYRFELSAEPGVADVPLIKSEIEAIFRPESFSKELGGLRFSQGRYYVTIRGVRVPLDVYEFDKGIVKEFPTKTESTKFYSDKYAEVSSGSYVSPRVYSVSSSSSLSYQPYSQSMSVSSLSGNVSSSVSSVSKSFSYPTKSLSIQKRSYNFDSYILESSGLSYSKRNLRSYSINVGLPPSEIPPSEVPTSIPIPKAPFSLGKNRKRMPKRIRKAFSILIKRRGKFIPFASGLPRGRALKTASDEVVRNLSRQFKIVESGTTTMQDIEFTPGQSIYRKYKVRKGKRIPLSPGQFIQRTGSLLQTTEERELIKQARLMKQLGI